MAIYLFRKVVTLKYVILINGLALCFVAGRVTLSFGSAMGKPVTKTTEEVIFLFTDCCSLSVEETL